MKERVRIPIAGFLRGMERVGRQGKKLLAEVTWGQMELETRYKFVWGEILLSIGKQYYPEVVVNYQKSVKNKSASPWLLFIFAGMERLAKQGKIPPIETFEKLAHEIAQIPSFRKAGITLQNFLAQLPEPPTRTPPLTSLPLSS